MVIWIIGLSGAGKSTIGKEVYRRWRETDSNTVLLDGDHLRQIFSHDNIKTDYSLDGRRVNAERALALCKLLDDQKINVVCCLLSIFEEHRQWNRDNLNQYVEVFIDVPLDELVARDDISLYAPALSGKTNNVVGVDIPFEIPLHPNLVINNTHDSSDIDQFVTQILSVSGITDE